MADRVFIHVGAPKSGTTYLQSVLWANKARLATAGILLPGKVEFDHNLAAVVARSDEEHGHRARRIWSRMLAEVNAWPGTAILSNEWFSLADEDHAAGFVNTFQGAQVHLVFTARDFLGIVPAAWQERLKLGHASTLGEFLPTLEAPGERWSWWTLDPAEVLARWGASVPPERVHVVTVPPSGSDPNLLWERFCEACAIPADICDLSQTSANESLGAESAGLLERIGPRLRDAVDADTAPWTEQYRWLRRYVGHRLLVPRGGSKIALRDDDVARLRLRSGDSIDRLKSAGYDVVGDLSDLVAARIPASAVHPDDVSDTALLDVASDLVVDLLRRARDEAHRADQAERDRDHAVKEGERAVRQAEREAQRAIREAKLSFRLGKPYRRTRRKLGALKRRLRQES